MAKCAKCGRVYVERPGELCMNCKRKAFRGNTGNSPKVPFPGGNSGNGNRPLSPSGSKPLFPSDNANKRPLTPSNAGRSGTSRAPQGRETTPLAGGGTVEGTVRFVVNQQLKEPFLARWFKSMISFTPFSTGGYITTFQVFDSLNATASNEVVVYGKIVGGMIHDGNIVSVRGRRNRFNTIEANSIVNMTSNTRLHIQNALSPIVLWVVTLGLAGLLWFLLSSLAGGSSGASGASASANMTELLFIVVLFVVAVAAAAIFLRNSFFRHPFIFLAVILFLVLSFFPGYIQEAFGPLIVMFILMIVAFRLLFKGHL